MKTFVAPEGAAQQNLSQRQLGLQTTSLKTKNVDFELERTELT